jgi:hypothetical protein
MNNPYHLHSDFANFQELKSLQTKKKKEALKTFLKHKLKKTSTLYLSVEFSFVNSKKAKRPYKKEMLETFLQIYYEQHTITYIVISLISKSWSPYKRRKRKKR